MIEFTDRYQALGIPYPNPETMCEGQCEGVGSYPLYAEVSEYGDVQYKGAREEATPEELEKWMALHDQPHDKPCDGWHFIECGDCGGTGKRVNDGR